MNLDPENPPAIDIKGPYFWPSTLGLIFGWLLFMAEVVKPANNQISDRNLLLAAMYIIVGTLAYRSAKRRKRGLRVSTWYRILLEFLAIGFILRGFWTTTDLIETHPVPHFIVPIWILVAYLVANSDYEKMKSYVRALQNAGTGTELYRPTRSESSVVQEPEGGPKSRLGRTGMARIISGSMLAAVGLILVNESIGHGKNPLQLLLGVPLIIVGTLMVCKGAKAYLQDKTKD